MSISPTKFKQIKLKIVQSEIKQAYFDNSDTLKSNPIFRLNIVTSDQESDRLASRKQS